MSYWANHPEEYDAITRDGVVAYLKKEAGTSAPLDETEAHEFLAECEESTFGRLLLRILERNATSFIIDKEGDYWAGKVDAAQSFRP